MNPLLLALLVAAIAAAIYWFFFRSKCPPQGLSPYWTETANNVPLPVTSLSHCNAQWYYDGKPTCVGMGSNDVVCPPGMFCAGTGTRAGKIGYGSYQLNAVKDAIANGGVHASCPV